MVGLKFYPLMMRIAFKHIQFAFISPLGEFTNMGFVITHTGIPCFFMKVYAMKECEALESKSTVAEFELTGNIPITTSGAS